MADEKTDTMKDRQIEERRKCFFLFNYIRVIDHRFNHIKQFILIILIIWFSSVKQDYIEETYTANNIRRLNDLIRMFDLHNCLLTTR